MNQHKEILRLIETVDPTDRAKLDEIDARFQSYLWDYGSFCGYEPMQNTEDEHVFTLECSITLYCPHYTRSRDALKEIRPPHFYINNYGDADGFVCIINETQPRGFVVVANSGFRKSEELAELHAIIQVIAHERGEG